MRAVKRAQLPHPGRIWAETGDGEERSRSTSGWRSRYGTSPEAEAHLINEGKDSHRATLPARLPRRQYAVKITRVLVVLRGDLVQFGSALWTRIGRSAPLLGSREYSELLHHAKVIAHSPVLGDPAVL